MLNSSNLSITVGGQTASFTVGNATLNDAIKTFDEIVDDIAKSFTDNIK